MKFVQKTIKLKLVVFVCFGRIRLELQKWELGSNGEEDGVDITQSGGTKLALN